MEHTAVEFKIRGWDVDSAKKILEILKGFDFIKEFDKIYRQKDLVRVRMDRNSAFYLFEKLNDVNLKKLGKKIEFWDEDDNEDDNFIAFIRSFDVWGYIYFEFER